MCSEGLCQLIKKEMNLVKYTHTKDSIENVSYTVFKIKIKIKKGAGEVYQKRDHG